MIVGHLGLHDKSTTLQRTVNVYEMNVCSGSVVVAAYDFESGCLGLNPEWG